MVPMLRSVDCGPVAIANYLEKLGVSPSDIIYSVIMKSYNFPGTNGLSSDFWDSPPRHFRILRKLTNREDIGLCEDSWTGLSVVLLMITPMCWHWIVQIGDGTIHDGFKVTPQSITGRFPGSKVILKYRLGSTVSLPWYWSIWWLFTRIFTKGIS